MTDLHTIISSIKKNKLRDIADEYLYVDVPLAELKSKHLHECADNFKRLLAALEKAIEQRDYFLQETWENTRKIVEK